MTPPSKVPCVAQGSNLPPQTLVVEKQPSPPSTRTIPHTPLSAAFMGLAVLAGIMLLVQILFLQRLRIVAIYTLPILSFCIAFENAGGLYVYTYIYIYIYLPQRLPSPGP